MVQRGRGMAIVGLLWLAFLTHGFNLEPGAVHKYSYPYTDIQERESYFGYSVALQHVEKDKTDWLIVGAPRANSSFFDKNEIQEPGAVFRCSLTSNTCEELLVDDKGNEAEGTSRGYHIDLKNYGWLGGSLDTQPKYTNQRQATCVCAPMWKDQRKKDFIYMNGACYISYDPISNATKPFAKEVPLVDKKKQEVLVEQKKNYLHAYGQAGFSVHFPDDSKKLIVGAPGLMNWNGSVILFEDEEESSISSQRKKRDVNHADMFIFSDPSTIDNIEENALFGYSVSSGKFLLPNVTHYAAGAPHAASSFGKVFIFEFSHESKLLIRKEFKGDQMGEFFGGALAAADINCDGLDDLVVGSPTYSDPDLNIPDIGRIHTFLSRKGTDIRPAPPHYGNRVKSFARFGTTIASLGDLNADKCNDIVVGAPWEGDGAVYIFLGSKDGLKDMFSQRIASENFTPGFKGFGMAISRGIDIDGNGYPDLAIGNFLSGHALVVKSRPVVILSGKVIPNPPSVIWEDEKNIILKTCLHYKGYRIPTNLSVQTKLILDHGSASIRAVFTDKRNTSLSVEDLVINKEKCRDYEVTVKEDKINPDFPITMRLEYKLMDNPGLKLVEKPLIDPTTNNYTMGYVGIVKDCNDTTCKVDLRTKAFIDGMNNSLVIGKMNKLRVEVSNIGEAAYLSTMNITADPRLFLSVPVSHECTYLQDDTKASVECLLPNPVKNDIQPHIVDVSVVIDESKIKDNIGQMKLHINVNGEGKELNADDNNITMILQPATEANLTLLGSSEEEQVPYKLTEDNKIIVTNNARFNHSYILYKKGPTPFTPVDLTLDIPVNFTDGSNFVKVHNWKFIGKSVASFECHLNGINLTNDSSSSLISTLDASVISDAHSSSDIQAVSAKKEADAGVQYFNCSSSQIKCAQLYCRIQDMISAKVLVELEVDLKILAKHISVKGGANFGSKASATIQSSNLQMVFIGLKHTEGEVVTYIQPETLLNKDWPWWIILLGLLVSGLILGAVTYGLYKKGFFKRETLKELKAQRARLESPNHGGVPNSGASIT